MMYLLYLTFTLFNFILLRISLISSEFFQGVQVNFIFIFHCSCHPNSGIYLECFDLIKKNFNLLKKSSMIFKNNLFFSNIALKPGAANLKVLKKIFFLPRNLYFRLAWMEKKFGKRK